MSSRVDNYSKAIALVNEKIKSGELPDKDRETYISKYFDLLEEETKEEAKKKKGPAPGTVPKCALCNVPKRGHQCPKRKICSVSSPEQQEGQKRAKTNVTTILSNALQRKFIRFVAQNHINNFFEL